MSARKLQLGSEEEFCCIGKLLKQCQMPVRDCDDCWFGTDQNKPTLVRIAVFNQIEALNERRIPTPRGGEWAAAQVYQLTHSRAK